MTDPELYELARQVGADWTQGPYYEEAEKGFESQWHELIWPFIKQSDFTTTVELAAGHGRNSEKLRCLAETLYLVDINQENIDFLATRFADAENVVLVLTDGISLPGVPGGEATFIYSFDSMVHFDSDVVRAYLREFYRALRPGGTGFCHYSNYTGNPTGSYRDHPGWRNFMSIELFEHYATKEGLTPFRSEPLFWGHGNDGAATTDALTLFRKS